MPGTKKLKKDLMTRYRNVKPGYKDTAALQFTLGIGDDGALVASPARNQKPHIDLKLKLHKKMKKERPARTEAE